MEEKWISVKDRLPNNGRNVLACAAGEYGATLMFVAMYWHDGWCHHFESSPGITHWMPLPDPPAPTHPTAANAKEE